jgi:replicative DNA helicase
MDIDLCLVSSILKQGKDGLLLFKQSRINENMLYGSGPDAIKFINDFYNEYYDVPSVNVFFEKTGIVLPLATEPMGFYIDDIAKRYVFNLGKKHSNNFGRLLEDHDPLGAIEESKRFLNEVIDSGATAGKIISLFDMGERLKRKYLEAKEGKYGIITPWNTINKMSLGFVPGDFVIFVSRPNVGKTQSLLVVADTAWQFGYKVLFVCTEMTKVQIAGRAAAINFKISSKGIKEGKLGIHLEKVFFDKLDAFSKQTGYDLIGDDFDIDIDSIQTAIEQTKPDIVFVDGMYLVKTKKKTKDRNTRVSEVADELKRIARRLGLPVVTSTQFNREVTANNPDDVSAEKIAMADNILWVADMVFALYQTDDMKQDREMGIRTLKMREGEHAPDVLCRWDFDRMNFSEIGGMKDDYTDEEFKELAEHGGSGKQVSIEDENMPF